MSHTLKILCLSFLTALSLMAFTAISAQAAGEVRVSGSKLTKDETLTGSSNEILFSIPPTKIIIHCTLTSEWKWLWAVLVFDVTLLLSKCVTLLNGKEAAACKPIEPIVMQESGLPILHNSKTYILVEPLAGGVLATIQFDPAKCVLPEENEITGSYVVECLTGSGEAGSCSEEMTAHQMRPVNSGLFSSDKLFFGENSMTLEGTDAVKMTGVNAGKPWSVVV